jgi:NodT family efflux transporter outer membrane factor (OMF) lipoprotein
MKRISYYISYVCVMGCLTSCAVGPDFKRPAAPSDQTYSAEGQLTHFGVQHINLQKPISTVWWKEFKYPELNKVMDLGVKNSYSLVAIQQTLEQAKEMVTAASGQLWPQLSLEALAGRQKYGVALFGPTNFVIPPFTYYEIGPDLNYLLDVFGGTRRTIEKQQALAIYQQNEVNAAYLTLTGNIASTTLTIATLNDQIATTQQIINEDKKNLQLVQEALNLGSSTKAEELTTHSQLDNDETLLPDLRQQLSVAQDTLVVLVGSTPANWTPPRFQLQQFVLPKELPLVVPSELIHARPDILAAEATLHAASADVGIATANLYPSINLTASSLQEALVPANLFKASANAWGYLGTLTAPIFNGGTLRAERRAAMHAYQSAYANYQLVVIKAFGQVNDVLHALKYDDEAIHMQTHAVDTARSSLKLARLSFNEGNVGVLQILDAERLYNQARIGYVKALGKRYQDTVQLYLVLGGGNSDITPQKV